MVSRPRRAANTVHYAARDRLRYPPTMQTKIPRIKLFLAIAALSASVVAAGCGNDSKADLANGKQLFSAKCGSCHTLARADALGLIGPDLDNSFRQARRDGMNDKTIEGVVLRQIEIPSQRVVAKVKMPANILTGMDARDVAAFVGYVAARDDSR